MSEGTGVLPRGYEPGRFQHALEDGRIQCDLCPRRCRLHDGQRAFCFVRQRVGDRIYLTSYGQASGFCVDPIEKKPLNHFLPGSSVLSFGTAGCNLGCKFCQNWEISKAREVDVLSSRATPERIAEAAREAGSASVAFTYNDPVIFAEYAIDTAKAARERGIRSVLVSAGYVTREARGELFTAMDAANIDLKAFTPEFYKKLCLAELEPVLDTLSYIKHETNVWLEVTTLLIPGQNDGEDEVAQLSDWFVETLGPDVPLHFTAFHPDFRLKHVGRTPAATCRRARDQAKRAGIRHVYSGNISDPSGQTSYCAGCGHAVIERDGYQLFAYELEGARCRHCDTELPGVFSAHGRENFGPRRLRLKLD